MNCIRPKNIEYIYLFVLIFIQNFIFNSADTIQCAQCGNKASECSENIDELKFEPCTDEKATKCFTKVDTNGVVSRGCAQDNYCMDIENCLLSDSGKNNQLICKKCDGTDEKCSQTDMNITDIKYNEICNEGVKKCLVKVENKLITRSCANNIEQCSDTDTCKHCDKVQCNAGIFPPDRIRCYQCNDSTCNDVTNNDSLLKPCLNYDKNDECYTKGENEIAMVRGCKSDSKENQCSSNISGCSFCNTSKCNNLKYKHDQTLKCYQCSGENANDDCFKEQINNIFKTCKKQILYNETEYCYTYVSDNTIQRGCLHDNDNLSVDECKDNENDACTKCEKTNGCNGKEKKPDKFTCIVCRSDINELCWNQANKINGQNCRTGEGSSKDGCFHGIWNGIAIRGCVIDASMQVQAICKDKNNQQCRICNEKNCNVEKTSGAGKLKLNFAFFLILFTTIWTLK